MGKNLNVSQFFSHKKIAINNTIAWQQTQDV